MITIDLEASPDLQFRLDNFTVPREALAEFEQTMRQNLAFIETLPGFLGHLVLEKTGGPTAFNVATIAVWESSEAIEAAAAQVRAHYERIGFNMADTLSRQGITSELGNFRAPHEMQ